jgi:EmrB/QacA subfamily drug resistance transporter
MTELSESAGRRAAATAGAAAPAGAAGPDPRRWLILGVLGIAQLMVVLDATIVNIALPSAQKSLAFSTVDRQWVVTAYALAFGSLLLFGGRLGDLIGRKVTFLVGLVGFAGASAVGGAATSFTMLVVARASQGAFGALLAPAALSLLTTTFSDPRERGKAFGVYGAIAGGGGAVGLVLGGLLTEYLSWRWCLYVNLFFAGIAATGGLLLLSRQPRGGQRPRLDLPGVVMVSASMFGLVYGFSNAATHSWHTPSTWGFLAAGGGLLVLFAAWQARASHPLLPLRVVLDRNRGGAYLAVLVSGAGMFGIFLFLTYYLQQTLHYSPVVNGVAFLPMIGMIVLSANLSNIALLPRVGPKPLVALGMLLAAGSMVWLTRIGLHSSYTHAVLGPLLVAGLAFGFIIAPAMNTGTFGVAPQDAGVASAVLNTGQQIGGSIGTSLLNTLAASATASYVAAHLTRGALVNGRPSTQAVSLSLIHGYTTAFWWAAAIFAAGAVICGLLLRRGPLGPAGSGTVSPAAAGTVSPAAAGTVAASTVAASTVREGSPLMADSENGALAPGGTTPGDTTPGDTTPGGTADAPAGAAYAPYLGPPPGGNSGRAGGDGGRAGGDGGRAGGDGGRAGGQPVHGWVRQPDGAPIGGATVTLIDPAGRQAGHGRTGPDGSYQIPAPRQGTYTLIAIAGAHQPHASAVQVGSQPVELQVLLAGASRLTGGRRRGTHHRRRGQLLVRGDGPRQLLAGRERAVVPAGRAAGHRRRRHRHHAGRRARRSRAAGRHRADRRRQRGGRRAGDAARRRGQRGRDDDDGPGRRVRVRGPAGRRVHGARVRLPPGGKPAQHRGGSAAHARRPARLPRRITVAPPGVT